MNLMNRREYDKWIKSLPKDVCTFCEWKKYQIVLIEGNYWVWIANLAPYWKYHTMLISKRHFEDYSQMSNEEAIEFKLMLDVAMQKYEREGFERFIYFWRKRHSHTDPKTGKRKFGHFHVHMCNDHDGLWDPILNDDATDWDVAIFK